MTTVIFSQHSSNPLEVPTSDPQNARIHQVYHARKLEGMDPSSDDPLGGYQVTEQLQDYQHHIQALFPQMTPGPSRKAAGLSVPIRTQRERAFERLTYSDSDDELEILPKILGEEDRKVGDNLQEGATQEIERERVEPIIEPVVMSPEIDAISVEEYSKQMVEEEYYETDEELSIQYKDPAEREEIEEEIAELEEAVPELVEDYKLVDRIGSGTFSSVYKAVDLSYWVKWHNGVWKGNHPQDSSSYYQTADPRPGSKVFVAVKRVYVTSSPERIRNEISILEDCRGCRHVSQLITAFRHKDQVVVIMPFFRNDDFRDIYKSLSMTSLKSYFRSLLRALRDIHARGIIHRDVKPANFLFDSRMCVGTLCDFGLACRIDLDAKHSNCLHTPASREHIHGQKKSSKMIDTALVKSAQREARQRSVLPSDRVGYLEKDMRPHSKANRAGTRGFRAPEVLLKCNDQTGAVDIWSAGMIFLFFLTGKFPLFQSNDDIEALMEIATIIGKRRMEAAATLHNRTFATNVPSIPRDGMTWREFVQKLNPDIFKTSRSSDPDQVSDEYFRDLELAIDLAEKMLLPESIHRITARDALYHPFLAEGAPSSNPLSSSSSSLSTSSASIRTPDISEWGDDLFFPHPPGSGRCGKYHFIDDETEELFITLPTEDGTGECKRTLQAGEGIPIGSRPCEFHAHLEEFKDTTF